MKLLKKRNGNLITFRDDDHVNSYLQSKTFESLLYKFAEWERLNYNDVRHNNPQNNQKLKKINELSTELLKESTEHFGNDIEKSDEIFDYTVELMELFKDMVFDKKIRTRVGKLYTKIKSA